MINWITKELGTAKIGDVNNRRYKIIDVRDMVDKDGNSKQLILKKINAAIKLIKRKFRVIVCCDYGLSRSNAVAVGILVKHYGFNFKKAVKYVINKKGEGAIQLGVLSSIRDALRVTSKKPNKKTILITGASGFVGKALVDALKKKYKLITPKKSEVDLLKGPIELDFLAKKNGAGLIIHLANPKIYTTTQSMGEMIIMLKNVLEVCRINKIPVIYPSSWVVFGGYHHKKLIHASEDLKPQPKDTYGQSKFLCEVLLNQYKNVYGLKVCLLRLGQVYGLGGDKPKFIFDFFDKAQNDLPIFTHKYENGLPLLDLININDVISAINAVIKKNFQGILHIGSGIGVSTFEIAQMIKRICQSKSKISLRKINDRNANIIMNIKKAKKIIKWSPKKNVNNELNKFLSI